MSKETVFLEKDKCCRSLVGFYQMVAEKAGIKVTEQTGYNCRKICVTPKVQTELIRFMFLQGISVAGASTLLINYGPKACLPETKENEYYVEFEEGFATNDAAVSLSDQCNSENA